MATTTTNNQEQYDINPNGLEYPSGDYDWPVIKEPGHINPADNWPLRPIFQNFEP